MTGNVTALAPPSEGRAARLTFKDGRSLDADAAVVATGNRTTPGARMPAGGRRIADPWAPGALDGVRDGAPVLVVGTGLTMLDVAVALTEAHPGTVVHAVSRHDLLPQPHRCRPSPPVQVALPEGPVRLGRLLRAVRAAVRAHDGDWRAVVDGLRPRVPDLWAGLSLDDKRRFLVQVSRYWEVHRHRVSPATAAAIDGLRAAGRLRVMRGAVRSADVDDAGVDVRLDCAEGSRELRVEWLINATGPRATSPATPSSTSCSPGVPRAGTRWDSGSRPTSTAPSWMLGAAPSAVSSPWGRPCAASATRRSPYQRSAPRRRSWLTGSCRLSRVPWSPDTRPPRMDTCIYLL